LRNILGSFLFSGDDIDKPVRVLSGGERNRLALAKLLLRPANLLLLDEPTNHLDLQSKEVLLEALKKYQGTIVFVSHDRYFVDSLASRVVAVGGGRIDSYPGNYEDFLAARQQLGDLSHSSKRVEQLLDQQLDAEPHEDKTDRLKAHAQRKEEQRQQQRRERALHGLEEKIAQAEGKLAELEKTMAQPDLYQDQEKWRHISQTHEQLRRQLDDMYLSWEHLQET
jgi:ATP-binding cassette subfamily F protein 3